MAPAAAYSIASFLSTTPTPPSVPFSFSSISKPLIESSSSLSSSSSTKTTRRLIISPPSLLRRRQTHLFTQPRAGAAAPSGTQKQDNKSTSAAADDDDVVDRVQQLVHTAEEFDTALRSAGNKLVVVEYATAKSHQSQKIYPFMVQLSRTCGDVEFLLVMGDESEEAKELCRREKIDKVPHFSFYKDMEKVHDEEGISPDELMGDVLYYGNSHSSVVQLHSGEDAEGLMEEHKADGKLLVLDVGLKHCGPCVKVYPTVLKLSRSMADTVVFARMNGDENDSCMQFLKDMEVIQVPTFLFIRDGQICGRYVGSGKGELIGEILRYQGVRVTY